MGDIKALFGLIGKKNENRLMRYSALFWRFWYCNLLSE